MHGTGTVTTWDDPRGYGTATEDGTGRELFVHCTALTDGTRTVAVGTPVSFDVVPGHHGRYEARRITAR